VHTWYDALEMEDKDELGAALLVVEGLRRFDGVDSAEALLDRLPDDRWRRLPAPAQRTVDASFGSFLIRARDELTRCGLKPVRKLESVPDAELESVSTELRARLGGDLSLATRSRSSGSEIFYGARSEAVEEAARLTDAVVPDQGSDPADAYRRLGALLGYPTCCVDAFVALSDFEKIETEWGLVALRSRSTAPVQAPLFLALMLYDLYRPCDLACPRSLALGTAIEETLEAARIRPAEGRPDWSRYLYLLYLDAPGHAAFLERLSTTRDGVGYRPLAMIYQDTAMEAVERGDRLQIGPQQIAVYRSEERIATFPGNAVLLDAGRLWGDPDYFLALHEALKVSHGARARARVTAEASEAPPASDIGALETTVRSVLEAQGGELRLVRFEDLPADSGAISPRSHVLLEGPVGGVALTVVSRPVLGADNDSRVAGVTARFENPEDGSRHHAFIRALAGALDPRSAPPEADDLRWLRKLVENATYPLNAAPRVFAGRSPCWPVLDSQGQLILALVNARDVLEVLVLPKERIRNPPATTRRCAVGYYRSTPLDTPQRRAAFDQFVRHLSELD
jgi:hypothetical protein